MQNKNKTALTTLVEGEQSKSKLYSYELHMYIMKIFFRKQLVTNVVQSSKHGLQVFMAKHCTFKCSISKLII